MQVLRKNHLPEHEFELRDAEFQQISRLVHKTAGLKLSDSKRTLVYSRLAKRVRELGLNDFRSYMNYLDQDQSGDELGFLIAVLTTNVTSFFREEHHFDHLRGQVLPDLIARARVGSRIRLWSSACSSGQEPYSIALSILQLCPEACDYDVRVLATDIDPNMLKIGQTGRFAAKLLDPVPKDMRVIVPRPEADGDTIVMPEAAKSLISFRRLNLIEDWPFSGLFEAIFCRNVAIYFDKATQQQLWSRLAGQLVDGGHFYIGHSERVTGPIKHHLASTGVTQYQKLQAPPAVGTQPSRGK